MESILRIVTTNRYGLDLSSYDSDKGIVLIYLAIANIVSAVHRFISKHDIKASDWAIKEGSPE